MNKEPSDAKGPPEGGGGERESGRKFSVIPDTMKS